MTDIERILAEENEELKAVNADLLAACKRVRPACEGLIAEISNHGVADWGAVNDMLLAVNAAIAKAKEVSP